MQNSEIRHMPEWTIDDGKYLINVAREAIKYYGKTKKYIQILNVPEKYKVSAGAFVTIKNRQKELLGCIGRPYPSGTLINNVIESAVDAAYFDPRFPPLDPKEADNVLIEVSILTPPIEVLVKRPEDYLKEIKVGRDGIIVEWALGSGLLLPQVPVEEGWNVEEFLSYGCLKAGADRNLWRRGGIRLYRFSAYVFGEKEPKGEVEQVNLEL